MASSNFWTSNREGASHSPLIIIKERLSGKKNDDTNFIILLVSYIAMARQSINAVLQYLIVKSSEGK